MQTQYTTLYNQLLRSTDQMLAILDKANSAIEKGVITEEGLLAGRLAPDMFPFTKQVQIFADLVQGSVCRLSGIEKPSVPDTEETLSDLIARIEMTKAYVKQIDAGSLQAEGKQIHLGWMPSGMYFAGPEYAEKFVLQNTFFHLVTAYNILRAQGGEIGKMDYLGNIEMKQS
jgi:uncharacterized protein